MQLQPNALLEELQIQDDEITRLRAQLADAELALRIWDQGENSEYWLRWRVRPK